MVAVIERHQAQQPDQRAALIERMSGQYLRFDYRKKKLRNIGTILRDDLILLPTQCQAAREHLLSLRNACQEVHRFYNTLPPLAMKIVAPWGTLTMLQCLEEIVTELILLLCAFELCPDPSYARVQIQLEIRKLYPCMFATFDAITGQLKALMTKAGEQEGVSHE